MDTPTSGPLWRRPALGALALFLVTTAVYWPATGNGFVNYDDDLYVTNNPRVLAGLGGETLGWAFTTTELSNWHPVTWLSHTADAQAFGLDPRGHHATSVVLHALNAALLFWLLCQATGAWAPSLLVAALFALHPLNVQSVAWISERKNVLSTLFWLLTLWAYGAWTRRPRAIPYLAALAALALSLMTKPMAVTMPFVLLLLDYWPLDRWSRGQRRLWLEKLPFLAMAIALSVIAFVVQREAGSMVATETIAWPARAANAIWSYLAYLGQAVWPAGLAAFYPHPEASLPAGRVAAAAVLLLAVTGVLFVGRERLRPQLVGWLWYLGTLVPVIGLVQVGTQAMADRYAYVPLIGIFVAVAWTGAALVARGYFPREVAVGLAAVALVALGVATVQQTAVWHDSISLFEHTTAVEPEAWVAHYNLGNAYDALGRHEEAVVRFRETARLRPEFARAHNNLANALDALGRTAEALPSYERAVQLKPDLVEAHNNLGIAYAALGRHDAGMAALRTALQLRPDFMEAHLNLSIELRELGQLEEAKKEADIAVSLRPDAALPRFHRGLALVRLGDEGGARRDQQVLLGLDPRLAERLRTLLDGPPAATAPPSP
ncbi:MAG: tetratricopeptide repeat protein [Vicinamibacteria bacterium]